MAFKFFPTLKNRDEFFEEITREEGVGGRMLRQFALLALLAFVYGIVMGSYHSVLQAIAAGVKLVVLFTLVLIICFPAFFIIQYILGSNIRLRPLISIILSGFVMTAAIMVSFAPIIVFFLLTGGNYYFLQLLHIGIFLLSGVFGMKTIVDALKFSCEKKNIYPQMGVVVFRFWVVIMAFVGIQLAWNLRPFLGDRGHDFQLFRNYEGNFYAALIYSGKQLLDPDNEDEAEKVTQPEIKEDMTIQPDSLTDSLQREYWGDE
jgi:hypothetical protein